MSAKKIPAHVVGIDVETTSLDPTAGDIIEIAAIRYDTATGKEINRLVELCAASEPLTTEITAITGITQEMVDGTKPFSERVEELTEFIGDATVFAHNASFDVAWLRQHGVPLTRNPILDTFALASLVWPEAESYNLGSLAADLELTIPGEHRAGDDVEITWQLLQRIHKELHVSEPTYELLERLWRNSPLAASLPWIHIQQASKSSETSTTSETSLPRTLRGAGARPATAAPHTIPQVFGAEGLLAKKLPGFTPREQQQTMAELVEDCIISAKTGFVEAPTGTGKTYAYLVPVLQHATGNKRAIIATHTKHLQDQLLDHDVPRLQKALGTELAVAVLKGRRNYVCRERLKKLVLRAKRLAYPDALTLSKVLCWLDRGGSGDLDRLNLSHHSDELLGRINADSPVCRRTCRSTGSCPYQQARRRAGEAAVVIVNHALLARMSAGSEAPLAAHTIIIDEAHQLEGAVRDATRLNLGVQRVRDTVEPLSSAAAKSAEQRQVQHLRDECDALVEHYRALLQQTGAFVSRRTSRGRLRLTDAVRRSSEWQQVIQEAAAWRGRLKFIIGLADSLRDALSAKQQPAITDAIREAEQFIVELTYFMEGSAERIQWVTVTPGYEERDPVVVLHDVALSVAATLAPLATQTPALVLTSATLSIDSNFSYVTQRLGIIPDIEKILLSPFNLRDNMLIYLVDDAPLPSDGSYDRFVARVVGDVSLLLQGRTLVLMTSKLAITTLYRSLIRTLNKATIKLYAQGMTGGRTNIMRRFRDHHESVLLGTDSFWEGIDIPGESLSALVIPKLPFAPPDDPTIEGVAEAEGRNAFRDFGIPRMTLKLRQGVGRLIRSADDSGVVIILDSRLHRHEYGRVVTASLPAATVRVGSSADLIPTLKSWFSESQLKSWQTKSETPPADR